MWLEARSYPVLLAAADLIMVESINLSVASAAIEHVARINQRLWSAGIFSTLDLEVLSVVSC